MCWFNGLVRDGRFQQKIQAVALDFLAAFLGLMLNQPCGIAKKPKKVKNYSDRLPHGAFILVRNSLHKNNAIGRLHLVPGRGFDLCF